MSIKTDDLSDLDDMTAEITRAEVRALRREHDALRDVVEGMKESPRDPSIVERLIPREAFAAGDELRDRHRDLSFRLKRLKAEHEDIDRRWKAARDELNRTRRLHEGAIEPANADEIRATQKRLAAELKEKWEEIGRTEERLDEVEDELRAYVTVRTLPVRADRDVDYQA